MYRIKRGLCSAHYARFMKYGDPLAPRLRREKGAGSISRSHGYKLIVRIGHPLGSGQLLEHRVVLYDAIGPGCHPCHWCGITVSWDKSYPAHHDGLVVDHLDFDHLNNDPRPSTNAPAKSRTCTCGECKTSRTPSQATETTNGERAMKIDLDELTNADIIEIEDRTGMSFSDIGTALKDGTKPVGKLMTMLSLIDMRTTFPGATWEDALKVKPLKDAATQVDPSVPPSATTV